MLLENAIHAALQPKYHSRISGIMSDGKTEVDLYCIGVRCSNETGES